MLVYAGGEHIQAFEQRLIKLGYHKVAQQGDMAIIDYIKGYRNRVHNNQLAPVTGLVSVARNFLTTWKLKRLHKECAAAYKHAIARASALDLVAFFS